MWIWGFGWGMSRAGAVVCGFDIIEKSIGQARRSYISSYLAYVVGDITKIDFPGKFETIVFSKVMAHIENRQELLDRLRAKVSPK